MSEGPQVGLLENCFFNRTDIVAAKHPKGFACPAETKNLRSALIAHVRGCQAPAVKLTFLKG
jgi:hypothetical protein